MAKKIIIFLIFLLFPLVHAFSLEHVFDYIDEKNPISLEVDGFLFPVTEVIVFSNDKHFNIKLIVSDAEESIKMEDIVYHYFYIESSLENEEINASKISFRINEDFFFGNDIGPENIYLAKYDDGWKRLETHYTGKKDKAEYFFSVSDGMYMFAIAAELKDDISIRTDKVPDDVFRSKSFVLPLKIENKGTIRKGYTILVKNVAEWADWRIEFGTLNSPESMMIEPGLKSIAILITPKNNAKLGLKNFLVQVTEGDNVKVFPLTVNVKGIEELLGKSTVEIEKLFDQIGETNKIEVSITNNEPIKKRYIVNAEGIEDFGNYDITKNVLVVEGNSAETVYIEIFPERAGSYDFSVSVESQQETIAKETFSIDIPGDNKTSDATLFVISLALLIVALIFFFFGRKKR